MQSTRCFHQVTCARILASPAMSPHIYIQQPRRHTCNSRWFIHLEELLHALSNRRLRWNSRTRCRIADARKLTAADADGLFRRRQEVRYRHCRAGRHRSERGARRLRRRGRTLRLRQVDFVAHGGRPRERPTSGAVALDTESVGFIFQEPTLLPWRTVQANVELSAELGGGDQAARKLRADEAIRAVGLADFAKQLPNALSGGMKMRCLVGASASPSHLL